MSTEGRDGTNDAATLLAMIADGKAAILVALTVHTQCTVSARIVHITVHVQCTARFLWEGVYFTFK